MRDSRPNSRLQGARDRKVWTLEEAAEAIGVDAQTFWRWENYVQWPRMYALRKLIQVFGASAEELGFGKRFADLGDEQQDKERSEKALQHAESDQDVDRREAIKQIRDMSITLAAGSGVLVNRQSTEAYGDQAKLFHIDSEMWKHFEKLVETCWHLSKGNILTIVEPTLWAYLPKLAIAAQQPSQHQGIAAGITSQGYLLAAILAGHRDDLNARQQFSEQALSYADLAKDRNLQAAALRQLALTFDYKDRPRKALQTYQQTIPLLEGTSTLLRSRIYAGLADSYAQYEQEQEALRCLSLAYENFPVRPEDDPTFLYADCDYFTLILWEGLTRLDLGQPKEAERVFARVDGLRPKIKVPERVRIEFLNYQAETFTASRDMEQACAYLEEAVKASLELGSERRYSQASELYKQMRVVWRHESRIKALGDVFAG